MAEVLTPGISLMRPIEDEYTIGRIFEIIEKLDTKDRPLRVGDVLGLTIISSEEMVQAAQASQLPMVNLYAIAEEMEESLARAKKPNYISARALGIDTYGNNPDKHEIPTVGIQMGGSKVYQNRTVLTQWVTRMIKSSHQWESYRPKIDIAQGCPKPTQLEKTRAAIAALLPEEITLSPVTIKRDLK